MSRLPVKKTYKLYVGGAFPRSESGRTYEAEGQNVARGQEIGEIGDTEADTPMLHFEIRKLGKPVDPAKYLPPT